MTVRQGKWLILFAGALIALAVVLDIYLGVTRHGGHLDYFEIGMPVLFVVMLGSIWRRYGRLEAEHGPDYVPPSAVNSRPLLVGAALLAAILAAVAGFLIATRR